MAPAVLAAWIDVGTDALPGQLGQHGVERRSSCRRVKARSSALSPSATARWVHRPSKRQERVVGDGAQERRDVGGGRSDPVHARVHLDVDRRSSDPACAPPGRTARCPRRVYSVGVSAVGHRGVDGVGAALAQEEDGAVHAVPAQLDSLVDQGHGQADAPRRPARPGPPPAAPCPYPCALTTAHSLGRAHQLRTAPACCG